MSKKRQKSKKKGINLFSDEIEEIRKLLAENKDKPKHLCSFLGCDKNTYETSTYTIDYYSHKEFCRYHWRQIMTLFNRGVIKCVQKNSGCVKNHAADMLLENRGKRTVKFIGRNYDLCYPHWAVYRRLWRYGILVK